MRRKARYSPSSAAVVLLVAAALFAPRHVTAQPPAPPYTVEYYYKVQWGHFDEFMELYRRNHYPILEREREMGRILSMSVAFPQYHAGESSRWDMRFTIVWKDAATANDGFDPSAIIQELYPEQEKFRAEEQRRFEILLEHIDVPVRVEDPADWRN